MTAQAPSLATAADADEAPRRAAWLGRVWRALILPCAIVVVWSAVTDGGLVPHYILPSPAAVVAVGFDFVRGGETAQAYSGSFLVHFWASFKRVLGGFALGASCGVMLGVLLGYNRRLAAYIEPTLQLTRSVPGICWLPLALIWFGIGTPASIFLISLGSFYAVFVSTLQGVKYVDPVLVRAALSLGASQGALLHTLVLPAAFPAILSGLRIGLAYSW